MAIFILRTSNGRFVGAGNRLSGDYTDTIEHTTITRARSAARRAVAKHGLAVNIWRDYGGAMESIADTIHAPATTRASDSERVPPCAAFMGCLCVGHANGVDPDDACDTNEDNYRKPLRKPRAPILQYVCPRCDDSHHIRIDNGKPNARCTNCGWTGDSSTAADRAEEINRGES